MFKKYLVLTAITRCHLCRMWSSNTMAICFGFLLQSTRARASLVRHNRAGSIIHMLKWENNIFCFFLLFLFPQTSSISHLMNKASNLINIYSHILPISIYTLPSSTVCHLIFGSWTVSPIRLLVLITTIIYFIVQWEWNQNGFWAFRGHWFIGIWTV
jgi:hypothetical protein